MAKEIVCQNTFEVLCSKPIVLWRGLPQPSSQGRQILRTSKGQIYSFSGRNGPATRRARKGGPFVHYWIDTLHSIGEACRYLRGMVGKAKRYGTVVDFYQKAGAEKFRIYIVVDEKTPTCPTGGSRTTSCKSYQSWATTPYVFPYARAQQSGLNPCHLTTQQLQ